MSDIGGMEKYSSFFPFKYKEYDIPVNQCFIALDQYNCRDLKLDKVNTCMKFFAASANRPSACAYLMPVKNGGQKTGIPMKGQEVVEDRLLSYKYWILDGQHSIYAAKYLRWQEMKKDSCCEELRRVYEKRKARIVVDPQPHVAIAISAIANEEAQALYVKQPYGNILKHLRSQWVFNQPPPRPAHGVTEGSISRANWDVCQFSLLS